MWEITRKLSEEIFLLESMNTVQIAYSDQYNGTTRSSYHVETPYRHTRRKEDSKISIERLLPSH